MNSKNRDLKLDGLKLIMIFLVVLGHIWYNDWGLGVNRIIYSFHMPVFIFLSGYFTSRNTNREKQVKWLKQTLLIYVIAQIANFVLTIGLEYTRTLLKHETFDTTSLTWNVLISPGFALWYLVCLVYWRFAVWRIFTKVDIIKLLCISCVFAFVSGFIPIDRDFSFQRAFSFFPFFVLGMIFRKQKLMLKLNKIPYVYAFIGLLIGFVIARFLPTYIPAFHYSHWYSPIVRIVQSGLGLYLCLLIIRVAKIDIVKRFAQCGVYTLWIYIGHSYLIKIGEKMFPFFGISFNLITALLLTCAYCMLFICLAKFYYSQKDKRMRKLLST